MTNLVFKTIPDLCTGCLECEIVCSLKKTGRVNVSLARIKIHLSQEDGKSTPVICRHCKNAACLKACQVAGAMQWDERTGIVSIDEKNCTGCKACVKACPFKAIRVGPGGEVLKCDLCGGDPQCVKYCYPRPASQSGLPYPSASCLEYVELGKNHQKTVRLAKGVLNDQSKSNT
jgi:anaerobic carbon-monoxide dehydrogenase iron sulfur subunit